MSLDHINKGKERYVVGSGGPPRQAGANIEKSSQSRELMGTSASIASTLLSDTFLEDGTGACSRESDTTVPIQRLLGSNDGEWWQQHWWDAARKCEPPHSCKQYDRPKSGKVLNKVQKATNMIVPINFISLLVSVLRAFSASSIQRVSSSVVGGVRFCSRAVALA